MPLLVEKEKDDGMYQKQREYAAKLRKESEKTKS
nr:hypothetical protein CoNPh37_CDS0187 [Staphylococcus phage S-CoN_Ph37]